MTPTPRRRRTRDRLIAAGIAVVAVAGTVVLYLTSDIRAATLQSSSGSPSPSAPGTPVDLPTSLGPVWVASTDSALGAVASADSGIVVTTDAHGIVGRDASSGTQKWSYTRSNRTLCAVAGAQAATWTPFQLVDGVAAVYEIGSYCSAVQTFAAANGQRTRDRTSPLPAGGHLVQAGPDQGGLSGWLSPTLVEVWGNTMLRQSQYGDLPNPTQPDNKHLGCTFTDLAIASKQFATIEHCAAQGSHARVVLNVSDPGCGSCNYPSGWDVFKHKPRADIDTGSDVAMVVGLTSDRVAVLVSAPQPAVLVFDAAGAKVSSTPVNISAGEIEAAAEQGPAPAVAENGQRISLIGTHLLAVSEEIVQGPPPATALTTPLLPTSATSTSSGALDLPQTAASSAAEVDLASLTVKWVVSGAIGLPTVRNNRVLEPVAKGLAPLNPITGAAAFGATGPIPVDRGGYTGRVDVSAVGDTLIEWRGSSVVALR